MQEETYNLRKNAFLILKANYESNQAEIMDLVDDAEFNENLSIVVIQRAQQALLSPIARLEQEIAWLPELSITQTEKITSLLESNRLDELLNTSSFLPDLAKANILAHACVKIEVVAEILQNLLDSWEEFDESRMLSFLNEKRALSGFPRVDMAQLEVAINSIGAAHARNAAMAVWASEKPGSLMEDLVQANIRTSKLSRIFNHFVREYDNRSEPTLAQISNAIDEQIAIARQTPGDLDTTTREIARLLQRWDEVNQPVQVFEQHQGHEEGRSKKLYEKLRSLCIELANERGEFSHAKRLSEALLHTFPELESVAEVLKSDVETLENLDEQKKQIAQLEPLVNTCEAAKSQLPNLKSALQSSGFTRQARGVLKDIFEAFDAAAKGTGVRDAPFLVVRDLALFVNNERNDPETAFRLIDGLITYRGAKPSQDVGSSLDEERSVLHRNWKMAEMDGQSGNLGALVKIIDEMLIYAKENDRSELIQLKSRIERKQTGKKVKWLIYGGIAAAVSFFILFDKLSEPRSRASYQPTTALKPSTQRPTTMTPNSASTGEIVPPVGQGHVLTTPQIRYCVFQGERLEAIRPMTTTNYQINRFNTLIDDYNSRCSNYRYESGILASVRREALGKAVEFNADARRIVASW